MLWSWGGLATATVEDFNVNTCGSRELLLSAIKVCTVKFASFILSSYISAKNRMRLSSTAGLLAVAKHKQMQHDVIVIVNAGGLAREIFRPMG